MRLKLTDPDPDLMLERIRFEFENFGPGGLYPTNQGCPERGRGYSPPHFCYFGTLLQRPISSGGCEGTRRHFLAIIFSLFVSSLISCHLLFFCSSIFCWIFIYRSTFDLNFISYYLELHFKRYQRCDITSV
jgi:hypothetical protein